MSSSETNAASSIRNRPNSNGEAPGRRRIRAVTLALSEQALSFGVMVVTFSNAP